MRNGRGKSDSATVPANSLNKAEEPAAEAREGRETGQGKFAEHNAFRTQCREDAPSALERVHQAATKDKKQRFIALFHHIYDVERLRAAFYVIKKNAAAGADGETWEHYLENLEANLQDLIRLAHITLI
jgi:RNA-directed DNA polymerase